MNDPYQAVKPPNMGVGCATMSCTVTLVVTIGIVLVLKIHVLDTPLTSIRFTCGLNDLLVTPERRVGHRVRGELPARVMNSLAPPPERDPAVMECRVCRRPVSPRV